MATAQEKKPCAKCPKGVGVTTCAGCQQSFCIKHIIEHRQELAMKMDDIGQEHDSFRRDLGEKSVIHPLLVQIDQWEEESIRKIRIAANVARTDLQQKLDQMKHELKRFFDKITDELQTHRALDDYTETDLAIWSLKLADARKLFETPLTVQIVEDENMSNAIRSIQVREEKQLHSPANIRPVSEKLLPCFEDLCGSAQEIFDKKTESISLSEDGLLATFTGQFNFSYPTVFGKTFYRSGVNEIRLRVENKGGDNFFFGIVCSTQDIATDIFGQPSANGWWGCDIPVVSGQNQQKCGEKVLRTGDVVKLTLDCDKLEIRLENYRTQITLQSRIDIATCPFPWKIAISLARTRDTIRILR